ncbi:endonuclease/exonuclease/phosphatase family protein [Pseudomonas sp. NCCP-436]|uniref:endonuclease/exonuclease/phosphatase family protein n=1 Tax=Pseudomonas sp. NCCP-436 TaxID=2842481 RepID=UPI001C82558B|nr:endonuclease/exonuclease/phosphatase family protein [Pseudomonas sp. NCCP-436]GIZ11544.1 endonuclease [Pseudomonas sp. NCCP-436]
MLRSRSLRLLSALILLPILLLTVLLAASWSPAARESASAQCSTRPPLLRPGQTLKVMSWNLQQAAGHDTAEYTASLEAIASILRDEQPDVVLLQALRNNSNADAQLQARLAGLYPCLSQTLYSQSGYIAHPRLPGNAGLKLAILSRFQINRAERLQLPASGDELRIRAFRPRSALLVNYLPVRGQGELVVVNTHFAEGNAAHETRQQQAAATDALLQELQRSGMTWLLGGTLNLLPPGQTHSFSPDGSGTTLQKLARRYPLIPSLNQASGTGQASWHTRLEGTPRTLDYLLYSPRLTPFASQVRQNDTSLITPHLPLIGRFFLPGGE